jgi:hypothetical protein
MQIALRIAKRATSERHGASFISWLRNPYSRDFVACVSGAVGKRFANDFAMPASGGA